MNAYKEQQLKECAKNDLHFWKTLCKSSGSTVPVNDAADALGVSLEALRRAMDGGWDAIGFIYHQNGKRHCRIFRENLINYHEQNKIRERPKL